MEMMNYLKFFRELIKVGREDDVRYPWQPILDEHLKLEAKRIERVNKARKERERLKAEHFPLDYVSYGAQKSS